MLFRSGRDEEQADWNHLIEVSIHAPRAGRDKSCVIAVTVVDLFQSTRPARGATGEADRPRPFIRVSIHAPRAGRDAGVHHRTGSLAVSIHAPRAGRDIAEIGDEPVSLVSIHAPRAGRDIGPVFTASTVTGFNPRAPRGARRSP